MATKIRDIENEITGLELKNSTNEAYFPVDIDNGLTYKINRNELIDFIIKRGTTQNIFGTSVLKNTGNDANEIPYFITNNTGSGIVTHTSLGGLVVETPKNAFNKSFSNAGGTNGTTSVVAREDHTHAELVAIANENGSHTAVFSFTGLSSHAITKSMLLAKMKYTPTLSINPAIVYTMWNYDSDELTVIQQSSLSETITTATSETIASGAYKEFSSLNFPSLNTTKRYVVAITFTDDRGLYIATGSSS